MNPCQELNVADGNQGQDANCARPLSGSSCERPGVQKCPHSSRRGPAYGVPTSVRCRWMAMADDGLAGLDEDGTFLRSQV
jgi:hypothetical protein